MRLFAACYVATCRGPVAMARPYKSWLVAKIANVAAIAHLVRKYPAFPIEILDAGSDA